MKFSRFSFLALILAVLPTQAAAYNFVNATVDSIGSALPSFSADYCPEIGGTCGFFEITFYILHQFRPLLTIVAGFVISIYGIRVLLVQDDEAFDKVRPFMTAVISGLVLAYLVEPFVAAFYGSTGEVFRGEMQTGVNIVNIEVGGIINWVLSIVAVLCVLMIIIVSFKAVVLASSEESVADIRKSLFAIAAGIILLVLREVIAAAFIGNTRSPVPLIAIGIRIIGFVLGFMSLVMLAIVIYHGVMMILSFGNEERWTQAKSYFGRAALGLIVILVSLALVNFVALPGVQ